MTKLFRDFPPHQVRAGGQYVKNVYTLTCYKCQDTDTVEATVNLPDQVISKKFHQKGWTIGTKRSSDMCPVCSGVKKPVEKIAETLAEKFAVSLDGAKVEKRVKQPLNIEIKKKIQRETPEPAPTPAPVDQSAALLESIATMLNPVLKDLADVKAAVELQMEMIHSLAEKFKTIKQIVVEEKVEAKVWDTNAVREYFVECNITPAFVTHKTIPDESFFIIHVSPLDFPHAIQVAQSLESEMDHKSAIVVRQATAVADSISPESIAAVNEALSKTHDEPTDWEKSQERIINPTIGTKRVHRSRTQFFEEAASILTQAGKPVHVLELWNKISAEAKEGIPYKRASARLASNPRFSFVKREGWKLAGQPDRGEQASMEARQTRILEQGEKTGWGNLK